MESIRTLINNGWNWDLREFCRRLFLDPETKYAQDLFLDFTTATRLLMKFDNRNLRRLCQKKDDEEMVTLMENAQEMIKQNNQSPP